MKRWTSKIIFLFFTIALIIIGMLDAFSTRDKIYKSRIDENSIDEFTIATRDMCENDEESLKYFNYPTVETLLNESDAIAIIKPTGNREILRDEVVTEVYVDTVLYGYLDTFTSDSIYIIEPINIAGVIDDQRFEEWGLLNESRIHLIGCQNLLIDNKSYVVCIKFFKKPEGYIYSEKEEKMFILTNKYFGIFPLDNMSNSIIIHQEDNSYKYKDVKEFAYIGGSERELEIFETLRNRLFTALELMPE